MTNYTNEQMMEQMKTTIDEIFEQMKVRLYEAIDRVFDIIFSFFNPLKSVELKSSGEFHDPAEVDASSDFSKSLAGSNWSNSFQSKGVSSLIQEPNNEDETTKSLKINSRECLHFVYYDLLGDPQGFRKSRGNLKDIK